MNKLLLLCALVALAAADKYTDAFGKLSQQELETNVWVIFAAGSNGYSNYRHQSDICHGYQVAHSLGVPDEHIIVMMYDDIANSPSNPKPGQIFNEIGGPDVYQGVPKDYTKNDCSKSNFVKILTGEDMTGIGSGKTLKSTTNDHVFVFFDDHGGNDIICFPVGGYLHSAELETALQTMHSKGLYGKFVFYVEACYAGSMFYKINIPENMYILTAAPTDASSYAWRYDSTVRAYLADVFSSLWIEDTEAFPESETLQQQFIKIKSGLTQYSLPCQYGDLSIANNYNLKTWWQPTELRARRPDSAALPYSNDTVPAWRVDYEVARRVYLDEPTEEHRLAFEAQKKIINTVDAMASKIISKSVTKPFSNPATGSCKNSANSAAQVCIDTLTGYYQEQCGMEPFYLRSVERYLIAACNADAINVPAALKAINAQCAAFKN